ncbi:MAG: hypothetical protein RIC95_09380 [Vicingaceae bacterium]
MKFKIISNQELSSNENELLQNYWKYKDYGFPIKIDNLEEKYRLSRYELISFVKDNSHCNIDIGHCLECGTNISYRVNTRTKFLDAINRYNILCDEHKKELFNRAKQEGVKIFEAKIKAAIDNEAWETLSDQEFTFYKELIFTKNKYLIFKNLFNGDKKKDRVKWEMINRLENIGLLRVIRTDENSIKSFTFPPPIVNKFVGTKFDNHQAFDSRLGIILKINRSRSRKEQPSHFCINYFDADILFEKGKKIICSAWLSEVDNSLSLKITPCDSHKNVNKINNDLKKPKFVKDFEIKDNDDSDINLSLDDDFETPF